MLLSVAAMTALIAVMRLLGAEGPRSALGLVVGAALGAACLEYRKSTRSQARQAANRRAHQQASSLWQPDETDRCM